MKLNYERSNLLVVAGTLLVAIPRGVKYLPMNDPEEIPKGVQVALAAVGNPSWSLTAFSILWIVCGLVSLFAIRQSKMAMAWTLPTVGMCALNAVVYGGAYINSVLDDKADASWLTSSFFASIAILIVSHFDNSVRKVRMDKLMAELNIRKGDLPR